MTTTTSQISTATLIRSLMLSLDEHEDLEKHLRQKAATAIKNITKNTDPTRKEYAAMKSKLEQTLKQINQSNKIYNRIEAICLGKSDEVTLNSPWTQIPSDLRDSLAGHLETTALQGATELLKQAHDNPEEGAEIIAAGKTGTALYLLTGNFPKNNLNKKYIL